MIDPEGDVIGREVRAIRKRDFRSEGSSDDRWVTGKVTDQRLMANAVATLPIRIRMRRLSCADHRRVLMFASVAPELRIARENQHGGQDRKESGTEQVQSRRSR
jgi:hypothetical protein